jgi:hypothetical protein
MVADGDIQVIDNTHDKPFPRHYKQSCYGHRLMCHNHNHNHNHNMYLLLLGLALCEELRCVIKRGRVPVECIGSGERVRDDKVLGWRCSVGKVLIWHDAVGFYIRSHSHPSKLPFFLILPPPFLSIPQYSLRGLVEAAESVAGKSNNFKVKKTKERNN